MTKAGGLLNNVVGVKVSAVPEMTSIKALCGAG